MSDFREELIKLGRQNPDLQKHIQPILKQAKMPPEWGMRILEDLPNVLDTIKQDMYRATQQLNRASTDRAYDQALAEISRLSEIAKSEVGRLPVAVKALKK